MLSDLLPESLQQLLEHLLPKPLRPKSVPHNRSNLAASSGDRASMMRWLSLPGCLFMLCWVALSSSVAAGTDVSVQPGQRIALGQAADILLDAEQSFTIDDVVQMPDHFKAPPSPNLNFGYRKDAIWVRFSLHNPLQYPQDAVLEVGYNPLDAVSFFAPDLSTSDASETRLSEKEKRRYSEIARGDSIPFHTRPISLRNTYIEFSLPPGQSVTYFLRVASTSSISIPLHISDEKTFKETLQFTNMFEGAYFGIIIGLGLYNLFLFISSRSKTYFYYVAVLTSTTLFWFCIDGIGFQYLWPNGIAWENISVVVFLYTTLISALLFGKSYLSITREQRRLHVTFNGLIGLAVVLLCICPLLSIHASSSMMLVLTIAVCSLLLTSGVVRLRAGFRPARYFIIAWSAYLLATIAGVISTLDLMNLYIPYPLILKTASIIEAVLLSLGLADIINSLRESEARMQNETLSARAESKAKSDFLAKMSHEIRTPMNGVLGMAELLQTTSLSTQQQQYTDVIRGSGQALINVINDILDFSKIEAGKMTLEHIDFDLEKIVGECLALFTMTATKKDIDLISDIQPGTPLLLKGDPTRLRQILINLLGNAFKFTTRGQIIVRVHAESTSPIMLRIAVEDSGIGISEEGRKRLFQSFSQTDSSINRQYGGTGLGLSICKELSHLMGGNIGVDSEPGKGSTFWFTACFEAGEDPVDTRFNADQLPGKRLLIVDDQQAFCQVMQRHAEAWGLHVDVAHTGKAGLRALEKAELANTPYDVVLMDWQLPDCDGVELTKEIHRSNRPTARTLSTRFILATGKALSFPGRELRESGFMMALEKPLAASEFCQALVLAIAGQAALNHKQKVEPTLPDLSHLNILVAEDNKVNQMVIRGMLGKLNARVTVVDDGEQALKAVQDTSPNTFDIVLMDCEMPVLNGFDATRAIRELEAARGWPRLRIIALTAHVMEEHRQQGFASGMDDFLSKPLELMTLARMLEAPQPRAA